MTLATISAPGAPEAVLQLDRLPPLIAPPTNTQVAVFAGAMEPDALHVFTTSKVFQTAPVRRRVEYAPGETRKTLAELIADENILTSFGLKVTLDGYEVPRELWARVRPKPGHHVGIYVVPGMSGGGGGGGRDQNKTLRTVLLVVIVVAALVLTIATSGSTAPAFGGIFFGASGATLGLIGAAAITIGGTFAVNALLPVKIKGPETPAAALAVFGITGTQNVMASLDTPFPRLYGRHKIFPLIGAEPFLEYLGNDQYLRQVFVLGYGPLQVEDIRIGGTPIEAYHDVQWEIRPGYPSDPPLTLYTQDIATDPLGQLRLSDQFWTVRTTAPGAHYISIAIEWPSGLYSTTSTGGIGHASMGFAVQYRRVGGDGVWIGAPILPPGTRTEYVLYYQYADGRFTPEFDPAGTIVDIVNVPFSTATSQADVVLTEATRTYMRRGYSWAVPIEGTHEVRIIRHGPEDPSGTGELVSEAYWVLLSSARRGAPIVQPGLCLLAVMIKATDQLNGIIQNLSCVASSILPSWNGSAWVQSVTRNPASMALDVLQGTANAKPIPSHKIDWPAFQAWYQENVADNRTCDWIVDGRMTVREALTTIAATGRATPGRVDTRYTVVRDLPQTVPVNFFTPRNSWGYSGTRLHPDWPHAVRIPMAHNERKDYANDEVIVYADGYSAATATLFEALDATGVVNPDQAFKLGRYHFAVAKLRPEAHTWNCDFENLKCTRGDLVWLQHDVIKAGISAGRVTAVQVDGGGNATGVSVDTGLDMETGRQVGLVFRRATGPPSSAEVVVPGTGTQTTVTFKVPIPSAVKPAEGDLYIYGDLGQEKLELIVRAISHNRDFAATITAIPAAQAIHAIHDGPIPAWDPHITLPPIVERLPAKPVITAIQSDEAALLVGPDGSLTTRVIISVAFQSGVGIIPAQLLEVRYRKVGVQGAWSQQFATVAGDSTQVILTNIEDGVAYDIMLRSQTNLGLTSDWTVAQHFVVGKTTPPPDVPTVVLQGRTLVWTTPATLPRDFAGYVIRRHFSERRTWEDAQPIHFGILTDNSFPLPIEATGLTTYLVKSIDTAGNVSVTPAVLVLNLGDQVVSNLLGQVDMKALGWPGTIVNALTVAGDLRANSSTLFWGPDALPFWKTAGGVFQYGFQGLLGFWQGGYGRSISTGLVGNLFWFDQFQDIEYRTSVTPLAEWAGADLVLGVAVAAESWKVEYQVAGLTMFWNGDPNALFWKPDSELFWGAVGASGGDQWLPFPGRLREISRQVYELRVRASGNSVQSAVTAFLVKFDAPDVTEFVPATVVPTTGVRLPLTKQYRSIESMGLTLVADGGSAATIRVVDFGLGSPFLAQGPLVQVLDQNNNPTSGTVVGPIKGH